MSDFTGSQANVLDALALISQASSQPTMDELLARDPATISQAQRLAMIEHFRQERAAYEISEKKKADKKAAKEAEKEAA